MPTMPANVLPYTVLSEVILVHPSPNTHTLTHHTAELACCSRHHLPGSPLSPHPQTYIQPGTAGRMSCLHSWQAMCPRPWGLWAQLHMPRLQCAEEPHISFSITVDFGKGLCFTSTTHITRNRCGKLCRSIYSDWNSDSSSSDSSTNWQSLEALPHWHCRNMHCTVSSMSSWSVVRRTHQSTGCWRWLLCPLLSGQWGMACRGLRC
jgi:hypothetical protein